MTRLQKALGVLAVAAFGVWGCSQGASGPTASADKIKSLEAKSGRLEEDFRTASAARDQLRKKLTAAEEGQAQLKQEVDRLTAAAKERDELKAQFKAFTNERDVLVEEFNKIQKSLTSVQDVMSHYTAALNAGAGTAAPAAPAPSADGPAGPALPGSAPTPKAPAGGSTSDGPVFEPILSSPIIVPAPKPEI
jgi:TolA-binding protein